MKYKNIVWDWNGTLLNDLETGVNTLNDMLGRRGLSSFTQQKYKDQFGFPVVNFYHQAGFDMEKESMHSLSLDFVETYETYAHTILLNEKVPEVLAAIAHSGRKQYILSALREDLLQQMIRDFAIDNHFEQACGSDNIYASGKTERGRRMVETYDIPPTETLMIGDTIHDAEVAEFLRFDCILYTGGHNSEWRLVEKAPVIHQMSELLNVLMN